MAEYVVVDKEQLEADITTVADAIREKGGTSEQLPFPNGMADAVRGIQSGGTAWKETEITSTVSNVYDLMLAIVGGELKNNTCYCAMLSNIEEVDYQHNQILTTTTYPFQNRQDGVAVRYRNGLGIANFNTSYDAYADIGTIYKWTELEVK